MYGRGFLGGEGGVFSQEAEVQGMSGLGQPSPDDGSPVLSPKGLSKEASSE